MHIYIGCVGYWSVLSIDGSTACNVLIKFFLSIFLVLFCPIFLCGVFGGHYVEVILPPCMPHVSKIYICPQFKYDVDLASAAFLSKQLYCYYFSYCK